MWGFAGLDALVTLADALDFLSCAVGEGSTDGVGSITQDSDSGSPVCTDLLS